VRQNVNWDDKLLDRRGEEKRGGREKTEERGGNLSLHADADRGGGGNPLEKKTLTASDSLGTTRASTKKDARGIGSPAPSKKTRRVLPPSGGKLGIEGMTNLGKNARRVP